MSQPKTLREISCADDYDPNSMPVDRARELIRTFLVPVTATERVHLRAALGRVLAIDIVSPLAVPGHDNSAMDGYAVRFADLAPERETTLERVGASFAGKPSGIASAPGQCVRIFTGGVMPEGADTVVMQERASERRRPRAHRRARRLESGTEPALRRGGPEGGAARVSCRAARASRRARNDRVARHRRSHRLPQAARRVLFDGRRAEADRHAARRGRDLRQQPVHDPRHAAAPFVRDPRHGRRAGRARRAGARVRRRRGRGRRRRHVGRRLRRRGRLRESS